MENAPLFLAVNNVRALYDVCKENSFRKKGKYFMEKNPVPVFLMNLEPHNWFILHSSCDLKE